MTSFSWMLKGRCYRLGDNVPHAGGVIPDRLITSREMDPAKLVPHLFEETDPGFHTRAHAGDIIVAGRRFGMGPKMSGYIAMQALGLGLVCESMPYLAYRAAIGCGLRVLTDCAGVTEACATGDELEVDFASGLFLNRSRGIEQRFSPMPEALREIVALGGNTGWLKDWWAKQAAGRP
jgi:3-isopropylmalate/(R)-2-methylmalate dehydratase small subunit